MRALPGIHLVTMLPGAASAMRHARLQVRPKAASASGKARQAATADADASAPSEVDSVPRSNTGSVRLTRGNGSKKLPRGRDSMQASKEMLSKMHHMLVRFALEAFRRPYGHVPQLLTISF